MAQFIIPERNPNGQMRYQMGYALSDLAEDHENIIALDPDLRSSTGLHIFEKYHPDKLVKLGIAEQNLIAVAVGLSQEGYITFPCTFDALSRRFMDQFYILGCYSNMNVKFLGAYAGLFTGKAGATHQSDKELSLYLRFPHLRVIEPGFNLEMEQALKCAADTEGPFYLRLVRCKVEHNLAYSGYQFKLGRGVTVIDKGYDVGLISTGVMVKIAKVAANKLDKKGYKVRLDHHPSLKPFDKKLLFDLSKKVSLIVTLENHAKSGGLYSLVAENLVSQGIGVPVIAIGTDPEDFIHTGDVKDLLYAYEMTSDNVVEKVVKHTK